MDRNLQRFVEKVLRGEPRSVARAISIVENDEEQKLSLLQALFPHTGSASVIGITGSPGAGKSSLVNHLVSFLRKSGKRVGVLAVDPSSPFTGGALLGDRVRMSRHFTDPQVYIRSMGTRGALGGLARATREAIRVLDACGCEVVIVETVGVGQSELEVMHVADTVAVVLTPGAGDQVQAFKAGIMEIADLFIINKSDLPGADKLASEIESVLDLTKHDSSWRPPVVLTVSSENLGISQTWESFERHRSFLQESGVGEERRKQGLREEVWEVARHRMSQIVWQTLTSRDFEPVLHSVWQRERDPYDVAEQVVREWLGTTPFDTDKSEV